MKNEQKRGGNESHTLWTDREKGKSERKRNERKKSAPPPPPNSTLTRMHILKGEPDAEAGLL